MNTNHSLDGTAPAAAKRKPTGKRALTAALLAGGLALAGLGLASGTAQAQLPQGHWECYSTPFYHCIWIPRGM
jgi:hypothetical protein